MNKLKTVFIILPEDANSIEYSCVKTLFVNSGCYRSVLINPENLTNGKQYTNNVDMLVLSSDNYSPNSAMTSTMEKFIRDHYDKGISVVALGNAILTIAFMGLLDGKRAVSGDGDYHTMINNYPQINVVNDRFYTEDENIFCSIGGIAVLDLGLYLIERDCGAKEANKLRRELAIHDRPNFREPRVNSANAPKSELDRLARTIDWAKQHLDNVIDVDQLAKRTFMSRRSFDRKFRKLMGISAKKWLIEQQLNRAKEILEESELCIEEVAGAAGFGSSLNLRNHFIQSEGVSPNEYRKRKYL